MRGIVEGYEAAEAHGHALRHELARRPSPPERAATARRLGGGRRHRRRSHPATSASPSRPLGRTSMTTSSSRLMSSCGSRGISWWSPSWRATSLPAVTSTRADERAGDGAHAADDEHRQQQHADVERVLLRVRAADRPARATRRRGRRWRCSTSTPSTAARSGRCRSPARRSRPRGSRRRSRPTARLAEHVTTNSAAKRGHPQPGVRRRCAGRRTGRPRHASAPASS